MEIAIGVAAKIAEYTVAPIGHQLGFVFCYRSNVKELEKLHGVRDIIQHGVEEERRNGNKIERFVQTWLDKVDDIPGEAEEFHQHPGHPKAGCSNLWVRHQLSTGAKKMAENITRVQVKGVLDRVSYRPPPQRLVSITAPRICENFISRALVTNDIMKALTDPIINMIGVYGLGGVGKTTVVKEVAAKA
ncbi:Disease resistance protein [Quillaja saponaria]|uniref:Disease resistance protein n=1 Tax=Quillaja saponaria TaxID=32244 RepID=A0AAD7PMZ4_QUISA|nr:Disease resistance protein [Quillaja saponaria]